MTKGIISYGVSLDIDLHNEMERLRDCPRSRYIQNAIRRYNRYVSKMNIKEFIEICSNNEIDELRKEIKKRDK